MIGIGASCITVVRRPFSDVRCLCGGGSGDQLDLFSLDAEQIDPLLVSDPGYHRFVVTSP